MTYLLPRTPAPLAALALTFVPFMASAQTPAPARAAPDRNWIVTCADGAPDTPRECRLGTTILLQPQNQRLAQVLVTRQPETRSLVLLFQLPHGALIPAGMGWAIDESETQRLAYQTSDAEGLYAGVPLADDLLAALRRGREFRLSFVLASRRDAVTLPVSLAQFGDAATDFFAAERGATSAAAQPAGPAAPATAAAPPPPTAPRR